MNLVFAPGVLVPQHLPQFNYFRGVREVFPGSLFPQAPVTAGIDVRAGARGADRSSAPDRAHPCMQTAETLRRQARGRPADQRLGCLDWGLRSRSVVPMTMSSTLQRDFDHVLRCRLIAQRVSA